MFLCRTGRLSAAALDQAFKCSFLVQVKANRLRDVTLTLRKGNTFQQYRCFCVNVGGFDATPAQLGKQQPDPQPVQRLDSSRAFEWGHLDRVATIAVNLSKRVQSEGGDWGVSSRLCSTGTMQTRALSTKKSDAGEEQTANNKRDEQHSKEASAASSSTAKAPGEPEPEEGKPNKTQQLKKVFKEYGAVGVCFHIGISLMSLGMFYLLISSGIDMAAVLCKVGFSEAVVRSKMAAGTSTFVLAYAIHKLFAPVRISITLVSVPLIVRYFRKTGLFKPPTPAP
ncbi:protein FAM210B, mitochondrial isoform X2 [Plectropomus leopardus]|uniref:protein FAM210B, mitochondrial isoform X2 n=1 Tax=Plectropomus leopardus TaxID=160734 RepID=UPI001C4C91E3|nr:protein FAM210B, mitochondrial isoform X2 [Plectropomus leopardus]